MSVRRLLAAAAAAVPGGIGLAAPAAAHASVQPVAADAYSLTTGRLVGTTAALVALAGVVIAWLALARPAGRLGAANGPFGAVVALVAGVAATAVGATSSSSDAEAPRCGDTRCSAPPRERRPVQRWE
ncbi:hypothetical protein C1I97_06650, partial [Streptomyces sp. NTH33]|uniref:DUF6223 family protein n=1 Tax=Streptomyces sp. NTH33 TaxID=1735453 RepID=UPI000DA82277